MQQEIQLNIIPFTAPVQEADFAFYTAKQDGYCPIHKDDLNGAIEGFVDERKNAMLISQLMDQVYQFSRMYWKSVSRQNLPVTIKYPEMAAQIAHHFDGDEIAQYGKDNLKFL